MKKMGTLPIKNVLNIFDDIYADELAANYEALRKREYINWTDKALQVRVSAKIYTRCILSKLLEMAENFGETDPQIAVIGRNGKTNYGFYLPDETTSNSNYAVISRTNTGIIYILNVGYFVIDLGGTYGATLHLNNGRCVQLKFDDADATANNPTMAIKAVEITHVESIELLNFPKITNDKFPDPQELNYALKKLLQPLEPGTKQKMLDEFHRCVEELAKTFIQKKIPLEKQEKLLTHTTTVAKDTIQYTQGTLTIADSYQKPSPLVQPSSSTILPSSSSLKPPASFVVIPPSVPSTPAVLKKHPDEHYCPITGCVMEDPVIAEDGFTYENKAISRWFSEKLTSPSTNLPIGPNLLPNIALRNLIQDHNGKLSTTTNSTNKNGLVSTGLFANYSPLDNQPSAPPAPASYSFSKPSSSSFINNDDLLKKPGLASAPPMPAMCSNKNMVLPKTAFCLPTSPKPKSRSIFSSSREALTSSGTESMGPAQTALKQALENALYFSYYTGDNGHYFGVVKNALESSSGPSIQELCQMAHNLLSSLWKTAQDMSLADAKPQKQFCLDFIAMLCAKEVDESTFNEALNEFNVTFDPSKKPSLPKAKTFSFS